MKLHTLSTVIMRNFSFDRRARLTKGLSMVDTDKLSDYQVIIAVLIIRQVASGAREVQLESVLAALHHIGTETVQVLPEG